MSQGSNAEFVSHSKQIFFLLRDRLDEAGITYREEIGGHAAIWAERAQIEGCHVYGAV